MELLATVREWDYLWRSEGVEEWVHGEEHLDDGF